MASRLIGIAMLAVAASASAGGPYVLVTGRWEPVVVVVDLSVALVPGNSGTSAAIVSRVRVTPDVESAADNRLTPAPGIPSNIVLAADGRTAWVVNHAGNATAEAVAQSAHGHAGTLTGLNLRAAVDPINNGTTGAITAIIAAVSFGPVGFALHGSGPFALVTSSEGAGREDGGQLLAIVDLSRGETVNAVPLAIGDGGRLRQSRRRSCERLAAEPALIPRTLPNRNVGCFANANGVVISTRIGSYAFTANGGTDDVSVIDVERALAGDAAAEIARIPVDLGPWGIATSPDGALVAVTNRESSESPLEGNTISILDVERAVAGDTGAELARVVVGTDDPSEGTRPFGLAFSPDGGKIVVANFRSNTVSIVDVARAIGGRADAEIARFELTAPMGAPARPRGVAITPDGAHAVVSGGARDAADGGWLWLIDLRTQALAATVTHVGNEPYMLTIATDPRSGL